MGELRQRSRLPIHFEADNITFGIYSKEEVLKLSAVEVFNPSCFNMLGHPSENGLYDLRMGAFTDRDHQVCATCHLTIDYCSGHIGHIRLPIPVINPMYYHAVQQLLKIACIHCHTLKMRDLHKIMFKAQMQFLACGLISQAGEVREMTMACDDKDANSPDNIQAYVDKQLSKNKDIVKHSVAETIDNRMLYSLKKSYTKEILKLGKSTKCRGCGATFKSVIKSSAGFIYTGSGGNGDDDLEEALLDSSLTRGRGRRGKGKAESKHEINASELMKLFRKLYSNEKDVLDLLFPALQNEGIEHPTDMFFIENLSLPPSKSRPPQFLGGIVSLHPQTTSLVEVLNAVILMRPLLQVIQGTDIENLSPETQEMIKTMPGDTNVLKLANLWKELQCAVDNVLDANMNKKNTVVTTWGLKQLIERKEGMFRMNMMGKRVNHAARTVITPDPNVMIDEIGVPEVFAKKLSYPVPVTPFNAMELRDLILNGPEKHPGANMIEDEFGRVTSLEQKDYSQRVMLANTLLVPTYRNKKSQRPKIVHRHLRNGDALLLNRQPSLHKPSIMAHKARVLKGEKVMRLHYSNCKSYNADFDGDEMNIHFPQSERSRAEAYDICLSSRQYLGPKDGAPLQGLIQDHVIAGVKMTLRGRFFTRAEYLQLVYQSLQKLPGRIKTLPPAMIKPQVLWSGKQVLSTILINIIPKGSPPPNFAGSAKIRSKLWQNSPVRAWQAGGKPERDDVTMGESEIVIRGGILCVGILDKAQYGATAYSLTHLLFELYGQQSMCSFLSGISQMFTFFLQSIEGFTLGVDDILVQDGANQVRTDVMKATALVGDKCAAKGVGAKEEVNDTDLKRMMEEAHRASAHDPRARAELDTGYKEFMNPATNDINAICVPAGLIKPFPNNNLQLMVNSGAKGSTVNTTQISCLLGQIELEGKRPPVMISGKSLPSFPAYCTLPRAGGYIDGRFMTGIQPQEFFFHCMAGREGLIDTAVKTSRSGYLQRCLVKLLEGLMVYHDFTVRDSDDTVVQFQYGEDSMDICKSQYIKPSKLVHISSNLDAVYNQQSVQIAKKCSDMKAVKAAKKKVKAWDKHTDSVRSRISPFLKLSSQREFTGYEEKACWETDKFGVSRPKHYRKACKEYRKLDKDAKCALVESVKKPDPVASRYLPPLNFSSLTEVCDEMINKYAKENKNKIDADKFKDTMYLKVQQASVCPGEPVGVLAAQSVGEPSTQMTLNTFHFAGRGEMNVTLGIPRLREILMVASANIKTPSLTVPFLEGVTEKERDRLRVKFNRVLVSDILEEVQVREKLVLQPNRVRKIIIRFKFLPHKCYKNDFDIRPSQVLAYMENRFFGKVFLPVLTAITKEKMVGVNVKDDESTEDSNKPIHATTQAEELADDAMGDFNDIDEEGENLEGEGTDMARMNERKGAREYEEMDDEDERIKHDARDEDEVDADESSSNKEDSASEEKVEDQEDEALGGMDYEEESTKTEIKTGQDLLNDELMASGEPAKRRLHFLSNVEDSKSFGRIVDYKFDADKEQWCELTMDFDVSAKKPDLVNVIRKSSERGVIHQVQNIKKGFVVEKDGKFSLQTDGINVEMMYKFDKLLDLNRLRVNSIHDMARYYGIEAANKTIVQEVKNVFGVYGIDVDYRHLSLIADYMTIDGGYRPFNRIGIGNNPSPLQQCSFETAIPFLRAAILSGKQDTLSSPSACIVTGKHVRVGTGSVHLQYKMC